jgi:cytolysin (calcineurin-like family phosphatase)
VTRLKFFHIAALLIIACGCRSLPQSIAAKRATATNDIWFFVGSDTHYGRSNNAALNRQTIDMMNSLPGTALPEKFGGTVQPPRGVVLNGDLLDRGFAPDAGTNWAEFIQDYGLTGRDGRLKFPVYEGFGNHDGGPVKSFSRAAIRERNRRRPGLTLVSTNGLHYSWDWDALHLVQLNLFGGDGPADVKGVSPIEHNPEGALEFLRRDLAQHVGASGRPVIIFQHFSWTGGMSEWWTPEAKDRFYQAVTNYNIVALINGHSHGASFIEWNGLQTIHDGATARPERQSGDFLVVHVTTNELAVIQRKPEGWGIPLKKALQP